MTELSKQQQVDAGARAQRLLSERAFTDAVNACQKAYWDAWRMTAPDDKEGRELLHVKASVLDDVISHLNAALSNGLLSADQLARMKVRPIR